MKKSLIFVQNDENSENAQNVQIHIETDRASALELLALGTRSVMETLNISLYEYLEALMEAKEIPLTERVIIHSALLNRQEKQEDVKTD